MVQERDGREPSIHDSPRLQPHWERKSLEFNAGERQLDIRVDFQRRASFSCPECGALSKVHDTEEKAWHHLTKDPGLL